MGVGYTTVLEFNTAEIKYPHVRWDMEKQLNTLCRPSAFNWHSDKHLNSPTTALLSAAPTVRPPPDTDIWTLWPSWLCCISNMNLNVMFTFFPGSTRVDQIPHVSLIGSTPRTDWKDLHTHTVCKRPVDATAHKESSHEAEPLKPITFDRDTVNITTSAWMEIYYLLVCVGTFTHGGNSSNIFPNNNRQRDDVVVAAAVVPPLNVCGNFILYFTGFNTESNA